jgi:hypothetical protein
MYRYSLRYKWHAFFRCSGSINHFKNFKQWQIQNQVADHRAEVPVEAVEVTPVAEAAIQAEAVTATLHAAQVQEAALKTGVNLLLHADASPMKDRI